MRHRRAVAALAVAGLLLTSGCVGFLTGSESLSFESEPVAVTDAALEETGYEEQRRTEQSVERTFSVAGEERTVTATNHVAEYGKSAGTLFGDTQVARFVAFSTPKVEVAGQGPFNPVGELSNRELATRLTEQYDRVENVRRESNRTATAFGEDVTVSKFRADARLAGGQEVEVFLHVSKFEHGDDFVIAVAVHPTQLDEESNVDRLVGGLDHPAESSGSN
jgi:hypothetical protein